MTNSFDSTCFAPPEKRTYSVKDIMSILDVGETCAYSFLRKHMEAGDFRVVQVGRVYRVERTSFEEWFTNHSKETT